MAPDTHNLIWSYVSSEALWLRSQVLSSSILRPGAQCLAHSNLCKYLPIICPRLEGQVWPKIDVEHVRKENQSWDSRQKVRATVNSLIPYIHKQCCIREGQNCKGAWFCPGELRTVFRSGERWSERSWRCRGATSCISGTWGDSFQLERGCPLTQADNWSLQGPQVLKEWS